VVTLDPIGDLIALAHTEGGTDGLRDRCLALLVILLVIMTCPGISAPPDVRIFLTTIKRRAWPPRSRSVRPGWQRVRADYLRLKRLVPTDDPRGRMIALAGAERDEGNIFEALLEGWKHDVRNPLVGHRLQPPKPRRSGFQSPPRPHRGETVVAERLLAWLRPGAALVTVGAFHPATLSWLGAVAGNAIVPLGVTVSANPATSPISTAPTASTPRPSSTSSPAACLLALH
jgi:hypothetical protein